MSSRPGAKVLGGSTNAHCYYTDQSFKFGPDWKGKFKVKDYLAQIQVRINKVSKDGLDMEFELQGVEGPTANAIRRVLHAKVPTMAIEKVYMWQNTTQMADSNLVHRLSLIPIFADATQFKWSPDVDYNPDLPVPSNLPTSDEQPFELDPDCKLAFDLKIKCTKKPGVSKDKKEKNLDPQRRKELYENSAVYASDFKWVPLENQKSKLKPKPKAAHPDILIMKMNPGEELELRCVACKGIGSWHTKFSPVAACSYRFLPQIELNRSFIGDEAKQLQKVFSPGVINLVLNEDGEEEATVNEPRADNCSGNIFRYPQLAEGVTCSRKLNHVIFSIEGTGTAVTSKLVIRACELLEDTCQQILAELETKFAEDIQGGQVFGDDDGYGSK